MKAQVSEQVTFRTKTSAALLSAMEAILLAAVCLSPWAYGSVEPFVQFLLYVALTILLALWAGRILVEGRLTWRNSPVLLCLAAVFLIGIVQLCPLPPGVLKTISPMTAQKYAQLLPAKAEKLPLGSEPIAQGWDAGKHLR